MLKAKDKNVCKRTVYGLFLLSMSIYSFINVEHSIKLLKSRLQINMWRARFILKLLLYKCHKSYNWEKILNILIECSTFIKLYSDMDISSNPQKNLFTNILIIRCRHFITYLGQGGSWVLPFGVLQWKFSLQNQCKWSNDSSAISAM